MDPDLREAIKMAVNEVNDDSLVLAVLILLRDPEFARLAVAMMDSSRIARRLFMATHGGVWGDLNAANQNTPRPTAGA